MNAQEVYEKYQEWEDVFLTGFIPLNISQKEFVLDLWQAVKEEVEMRGVGGAIYDPDGLLLKSLTGPCAESCDACPPDYDDPDDCKRCPLDEAHPGGRKEEIEAGDAIDKP